MKKALFTMTLLIWIAAACAPQAPTTEPQSILVERPTATPRPAATPTPVPVELTPAQRAALTALSGELGLPAEKITLVSSEAVTWPDGCLGIEHIGVMCTEAQVPGYKIVLEANGQQYELHTNLDGRIVKIAKGAQTSGSPEQAVIKQLAANLGLQESDISVARSEAVEFRDGCLDVAMPDVMCAQVITPGHMIVLEANGVQYEYHMSRDGKRIQPASLAMIWQRQGGIAGFCDTLTVFLSGEIYASKCKPQAEGRLGTFANDLSSQEQKQFAEWITTLGDVNLETSDPKGVSDRMVTTLKILGTGSEQPTKSDQPALFKFAQDLYQKLTQ